MLYFNGFLIEKSFEKATDEQATSIVIFMLSFVCLHDIAAEQRIL